MVALMEREPKAAKARSHRKPEAAPAKGRARHDTTINLRVSSHTRELIDHAAEIAGKTRSEFMVETARRHAIDVLLDQRLFVLDEAQHDAFMRVLDEPPQPNEKLKRLLRSKAPWE